MPACTADGRRLVVELEHVGHAAHVERDHAAVLAAQRRDAADDARAATERHDRERAARAQLEQRLQLLVPGGIDDCVGRALGLARAQAHEVGIALARGVQHALRVSVADVLGADDRAQRGERREGIVGAARRTRPSATGGRGALPGRPSRAGSRARARAAPARALGLPSPTSASRGSRASQPLIRSSPSSASSIVASAARRTRRPPKRGASFRNELWRAEVTGPSAGAARSSPRSRRPARGARCSSVSADSSTLANGVPSIRWTHVSVRSASSQRDAEVGAHEFALACPHHLGEGVRVDVLDARHPRPPARQVMRVAQQLPELLRRGGDRAAATRGGHDCEA